MKSGTETTHAIDPAWLERMLARPEFSCRLFEIFLADEPARVEAMAQAIREGDLKQLTHLAHSLKGASAVMGIARVSAACKELEHAARQGSNADFSAIHARVTREMEAVYARLREVMPRS